MADHDPTEILKTGRSNTNLDPTSDPSLSFTSTDDPDAPRIEETCNVLSLQCLVGNAYAHAYQGAREHLLFDVSAGKSQGALVRRSPLNICLCLDRSGSMEGDPLAYAKKACSYIVDLLAVGDRLSIVTFAERGELVFAAQQVNDKEQLKQTIGRISIGNRTNLYEGLSLAADQVRAGKTPSSINRILLLTDGEPTAGNKDFPSIVGLISERKREGLSVTALGFGPDYNEELVAALARRTGGNYYYITKPDLLQAVFAREIDSLMRTVASEPRIRVKLSRGVSVARVYSNEFTEVSPNQYEANLIDVECGGNVASLWEVDVTSRPPGVFRLATAALYYENCATREMERSVADAVVEFTRNPRKISMGINHRVQGDIELYNVARQLDSAAAAVRNQSADMKEVLGDLERTQRLLIDRGEIGQANQIHNAITGYREGISLQKSLMGAVMNLDQGRRGV